MQEKLRAHDIPPTIQPHVEKYERAYDYGDRLPEGVDPEIYSMARAIADATVIGELPNMNDIKTTLSGMFISRMLVSYSKKNPQYLEVMAAMRQLVRMASENHKVVTRTNFATYDYSRIFELLDVIGATIGAKASCTKGDLGMYELSGFPTIFKKEVVYRILNTIDKRIANLIKKNNLKMYVTEDFNLAIENRFWQVEELTDILSKLRGFDRYKITPNTTLYVLDPE